MDQEVVEAVKMLSIRLEEAELRCKIISYALRGAIAHLNPSSRVAARRMANTATLAHCPDGERPRRLAILEELFPDARDKSEDKDFIPTRD